ncbi:ATP-binding protein [Streptomyces sp. NPDC037389]|uniref:ATP-binding protein n=1 Tax=Streptomyces sp. NPDC037389 TaxID=3155369 RepID=UPI0033D1F40C
MPELFEGAAMPKVALNGLPGAGKTTLVKLLAQEVSRAGAEVLTLKLAAPLYELQSVVYAVAGRPLLEGHEQDGQLLNFLGSHLRQINPHALTEAFGQRVRHAERVKPSAVLLCDDLRAPDAEAVTRLGFALVEISAPEELRRARKQARADLTPGDEQHPTEAPLEVAPWRRVENAGSLQELREQAAQIAKELLR